MTPLRTLLAATDFSAPSRHAAMRAALLAQASGARLELLHVLQGSALDQLRQTLGQQAETVLARLETDAKEKLLRLAAIVGEPHGLSPGVHLTSGPVLQAIAGKADLLDADLLVLGARGTGFMHHLLGSTAERMLRLTQRPMLVVKQTPHERYRRVLLSLDFSPYSPCVVALARATAPDAQFVLFNAYDVPMEGNLRLAGVDEDTIRQYRSAARLKAEKSLEETARHAGLASGSYQLLALHGDPAVNILEQEEELGVDLVVVGKHGGGMTQELLLGSVTKHVLTASRSDMLIAR